ncbi:MAG TPA: hypothetical protein VLA05_05450 [Coriobacteriia bacterium]|nr:hypothetical protein [Coriobacteriia bacterium]
MPRVLTGRSTSLASVATAALIVVAAIAWALLRPTSMTQRPSSEETPPSAVTTAAEEVYAGDKCLSFAEAEQRMQAALRQVGSSDWQVRSELDARRNSCTTFSIDRGSMLVRILPALHPDARETLDALREELYVECLSREAAITRLDERLRAAGQDNFEIRTDGPVGAPRERFDEVMRHVERGCFIYSGPGWTADGQPLFFLAGTP